MDKTLAITLKLKDQASKAAGDISKAFGGIITVVKNLAKAAVAVGAFAGAIAVMAAKGEDLRTMENAFASLSAAAGSSMDDMLGALQRGTEGLVSNVDLMKGGMKLLASGIPATAEQFEQLGAAAKQLGISTGTGAAPMMELLNQAIASGRTQSLAAKGIIVDATTAYEAFAEANGVAASSLTEVEKKTALFEETLRVTGDLMENMGDFAVGFGGHVDQLATAMVNSKNETYKFASAFGDALIPAIEMATGLSGNWSDALTTNKKMMGDFVKKGLGYLIDGFVLVVHGGQAVLDTFNVMQFAIGKVGQALAIASGKFEMADAIGKWADSAEDDIAEVAASVESIVSASAKLKAGVETINVDEVWKATKGTATEMAVVAQQSEVVAENITTAATEADKLGKVLIPLSDIEFNPFGDDFFEQVEAIRSLEGAGGNGAGESMGGSIVDAMNGGVGDLVDTALAAFASSTGLVGSIIVGAIQLLKDPNALPAIIMAIFQTVLNAPSTIISWIRFLVAAIPDFIEALIGEFIPQLPVLIVIVIAEVIKLIPRLVVALVKGFVKMFTADTWRRIFDSFAAGTKDSFREVGAEFADSVTQYVSKWGAEFVDYVNGKMKVDVGGGGSGGTLGKWQDEISGAFASGTPFVPKTGTYQLHQGEAVIPKNQNISGGGGSVNINVYPSAGMDERSLAIHIKKLLKNNTEGLNGQLTRTLARAN